MKMKKLPLLRAVDELLVEAQRTLALLKDGDKVEHEGTASGALLNDREIKADRMLGELAQQVIEVEWCNDNQWGKKPVAKIMVEGYPTKQLAPSGLLVCVDPLDGSLNYELRGAHRTPAPYSFVVTVLRTCNNPTFKDIIGAGLIDLRSGGDMWLAQQNANRSYTTLFNNTDARSQIQHHERLDLGKMILLGETYYPDNRQRLTRALGERKGYLRSFGSAALEMAYVTSGLAAAFVCNTQKQHELGAAYAFIKGAGGYISDFEGKPLDDVPFIFEKTQTPVIIACTDALGRELVELFRA